MFSYNGAGNEGPAILSLGMLHAMTSVTFLENNFYCPIGKYSADTSTVSAQARKGGRTTRNTLKACSGWWPQPPLVSLRIFYLSFLQPVAIHVNADVNTLFTMKISRCSRSILCQYHKTTRPGGTRQDFT